MQGFGWSDLVLGGVERNMGLIPQDTTTNKEEPFIPGLVTAHMRRGDYEEHCEFLANVSWPYMGWNALPEFPDRFTPITPEAADWSPEKKWRSALTHCFPSIGHMSVKLESIRLENPRLDTIYILSNDTPEWLALMRAVLLDEKWKKIVTSADRTLGWEEFGVEQAIGMSSCPLFPRVSSFTSCIRYGTCNARGGVRGKRGKHFVPYFRIFFSFSSTVFELHQPYSDAPTNSRTFASKCSILVNLERLFISPSKARVIQSQSSH
jgi:hypothetical protein